MSCDKYMKRNVYNSAIPKPLPRVLCCTLSNYTHFCKYFSRRRLSENTMDFHRGSDLAHDTAQIPQNGLEVFIYILYKEKCVFSFCSEP